MSETISLLYIILGAKSAKMHKKACLKKNWHAISFTYFFSPINQCPGQILLQILLLSQKNQGPLDFRHAHLQKSHLG